MSPSLGSVRRLCWAGFLGLPVRGVLGLPILGYGRWLCAAPLIMAGWCAPVSRFGPIGLHAVLFPVRLSQSAGCSVSVGIILTPLPYRMVHAGLSDYKKKKKKKIPISTGNTPREVPTPILYRDNEAALKLTKT